MPDKNVPNRLKKVATELNVGMATLVEFLQKKGIAVEDNPNAKVDAAAYQLLVNAFKSDQKAKQESEKIREVKKTTPIKPATITLIEQDTETDEQLSAKLKMMKEQTVEKQITVAKEPSEKTDQEVFSPNTIPTNDNFNIKVLGSIDLSLLNQKSRPDKKTKEEKLEEKASKQKPFVKKTVAASPEKKTQTSVISEIKSQQIPVPTPVVEPKEEPVKVKEKEVVEIEEYKTVFQKLDTPKVIDKIDLTKFSPPVKKEKEKEKDFFAERNDKKKRERIKKKVEVTRPTVAADDPKRGYYLRNPVTPTKSNNDFQKRNNNNNNTTHNNADRPSFNRSAEQPAVDITQGGANQANKKFDNNRKKGQVYIPRPQVTDKEVQQELKATFGKLQTGNRSNAAKYRKDKREASSQERQRKLDLLASEKTILKVTEFVTVSELAAMMDVAVTEVIATCMGMGLFVSINQRLDAENLQIVALEFGYEIQFIKETEKVIEEIIDAPEDLLPRSPIVTIMGHVDHGKTSLLDYIRKANVIAGEAGGITQHIGAYSVQLPSKKKITFLDTPGHEAFTAMRARGAQVTDIVVVVISADDSVMPQTKEAINHAQAAGVPIVFAFNKMDKPGADAEKIRQELSQLNILVEEWGGKYQTQEISAKKGTGVPELLEKVLLEAEMLNLLANPNRLAKGTVIESELDKGRGYVSTVLVETGTLKIGDVLLAGSYSGKIKAMFNERGMAVKTALPSEPVSVLGLTGAPSAGDKFVVMEDEREARDMATRRLQLQREQGIKTQKHITLDEIGRRIAIGDFKEFNIIVKGDVDGSVEALSDALLKLSTDQIQVKIILKAVGQISDSDVMLAAASDALIIGFNVRPATSAKKLAEKESIDIRWYSIIYDAIDEIKLAMEGLLAPKTVEKVMGVAELREVFKISKLGAIAGCMITEGKIERKHKIRVLRKGEVIHVGSIETLKRFKEDVKEVASGYDCGIGIDGYHDLQVGDVLETFTEEKVKQSL